MRCTFALNTTYLTLFLGCLLPTLCMAKPVIARNDLSIGSDRIAGRAVEPVYEWDARALESPERRAGTPQAIWLQIAQDKQLEASKIPQAEQAARKLLQEAISKGHLKAFNVNSLSFGSKKPSLRTRPNGQRMLAFGFMPADKSDSFLGMVAESLNAHVLMEYNKESKQFEQIYGSNSFVLTAEEKQAVEGLMTMKSG
ncbi:hypothetical protein GYMLUDRAFT_98195 [Collybiopsis luxurians FD-317 M1]|uniref:Uncharacterized protein n=1 Tax=Collybiopsis luxurians FD-317 M1 TaxID=944289 RepID=A0A0D0BSC4_9AGAR|nr:hypothetical protein GYMLUDRAFT_98195 [Collybiopsis luxurians FD-317 M1]